MLGLLEPGEDCGEALVFWALTFRCGLRPNGDPLGPIVATSDVSKLARDTGLSRPTVRDRIERLRARGAVELDGVARGRPAYRPRLEELRRRAERRYPLVRVPGHLVAAKGLTARDLVVAGRIAATQDSRYISSQRSIARELGCWQQRVAESFVRLKAHLQGSTIGRYVRWRIVPSEVATGRVTKPGGENGKQTVSDRGNRPCREVETDRVTLNRLCTDSHQTAGAAAELAPDDPAAESIELADDDDPFSAEAAGARDASRDLRELVRDPAWIESIGIGDLDGVLDDLRIHRDPSLVANVRSASGSADPIEVVLHLARTNVLPAARRPSSVLAGLLRAPGRIQRAVAELADSPILYGAAAREHREAAEAADHARRQQAYARFRGAAEVAGGTERVVRDYIARRVFNPAAPADGQFGTASECIAALRPMAEREWPPEALELLTIDFVRSVFDTTIRRALAERRSRAPRAAQPDLHDALERPSRHAPSLDGLDAVELEVAYEIHAGRLRRDDVEQLARRTAELRETLIAPSTSARRWAAKNRERHSRRVVS